MQLLALITLLLLLLQRVSVLATTPDNDHMERLKPGGVRHDDTGPVRIALYDQGEGDNEDPNLTCDEGDEGEKAAACTGNDCDPRGILPKSTKDWDITCLAGGEHGMTIFGTSVEGDNSGGSDGGGNEASIQENGVASKPKKRAVRADWYTFQFRGMMNHIRMNSSLGETYRNLATKAEQREFAMEHGEAEPVVRRRVRAAQ